MLGPFEHQVGLILETWSARHGQHEATLALLEKVVRDCRAELNQRQTRFEAEVRSLMDGAVVRANRYMASRPENCRLCKVMGYRAGPLYLGGAACNPIAYELRVDRQAVGETLIIELTDEGMIEASLGPFRPTAYEAHTSRVGFDARAIPLYQFDSGNASELVIRYLATVTARWPLGDADSGEATWKAKRRTSPNIGLG
jgi:hypothetical protein